MTKHCQHAAGEGLGHTRLVFTTAIGLALHPAHIADQVHRLVPTGSASAHPATRPAGTAPAIPLSAHKRFAALNHIDAAGHPTSLRSDRWTHPRPALTPRRKPRSASRCPNPQRFSRNFDLDDRGAPRYSRRDDCVGTQLW